MKPARVKNIDLATGESVPLGRQAGNAVRAIAAWCSITAGVFVFTTTVVMVVHGWLPVPFGDQWDNLILDQRQVFSSWLYAQHSEHRILFPRILFAIDTFAFAGTNKFDFFCNLALPLGLASLIVLVAHRHVSSGKTDTLWVAGIVLALLFSAVQFENFLWGFQVQFFGVELAAAASIGCLVLGRHSWGNLIASIGFSAIAVYTLASGIIVPFLAIPLAVWAQRSRLQVGSLVIAAAVLLASYLHGYTTPPGHSDPLVTIFRPAIVYYAAAELGNHWGSLFRGLPHSHPIAWNVGIGVVGFATFGAAVVSSLRRGRSIESARLFFSGTAAYSIGVAFLTALGRFKFGIEHVANASRYTSPMLLFWLSLLMMGIIEIGARPRLRSFSMALSLALVAGFAIAQPHFVKVGLAWVLPRREAATAMLANVDDDAALKRVFPDPDRPKELAGELRARHLAMFADPWSTWLGSLLTDHVRLDASGVCRGGIDNVERIPTAGPPQWRVSGWAWDNENRSGVERVILADAAGRVVGYALGGYAANPDSGGPKDYGWRGHFSAENAAGITAYALVERERTGCPLARLPGLR